MYIDHHVAQKIVDRAMEIIGHNVNVMNHKAVIVGSGDQQRIDQLHEGALQVIRAGTEIAFTKYQAEGMSGVQSGINIPITNEGKLIGDVGITGEPEQIKKYASLVVMTAELIIEQAMLAAQIRWDRRLQESIIVRLIEGGWSNDSLFNDRVERMKIDLNVPRVVLIVDLRSIHNNQDIALTSMQNILKLLEKRESESLLAILSPTQIVILQRIFIHSDVWDYTSSLEQLNAYQKQLLKEPSIKFNISMGQYFPGIDGIAESYKSASRAIEVGKLSHPNKTLFSARELILDLILKESLDSWRGSQLLNDYKKLQSKDTQGTLQKTLQTYFAENTDFAATAEKLHIHRNTLRYRLDRINEILGIDLKNLQDLFRLYMATRLSEWDKDQIH